MVVRLTDNNKMNGASAAAAITSVGTVKDASRNDGTTRSLFGYRRAYVWPVLTLAIFATAATTRPKLLPVGDTIAKTKTTAATTTTTAAVKHETPSRDSIPNPTTAFDDDDDDDDDYNITNIAVRAPLGTAKSVAWTLTLPLTLPLTPPFRIVQAGQPRSGSTFQHQLLDAIAHLKSEESGTAAAAAAGGRSILTEFVGLPDGRTAGRIRQYASQNESFVFKTHEKWDNADLQALHRSGEIVLFASLYTVRPSSASGTDRSAAKAAGAQITSTAASAPLAAYIQYSGNLENCSACEIDRYKPIFGLTDNEVTFLKLRMELYGTIRQCCGMQMSKYRMAQLHGCDVTEFLRLPSFPHRCDTANITDVEVQFHEISTVGSPLLKGQRVPYNVIRNEYNWAEPGDCAKFDDKIKSGRAFNNQEFEGCEPAVKRLRRAARRARRRRISPPTALPP